MKRCDYRINPNVSVSRDKQTLDYTITCIWHPFKFIYSFTMDVDGEIKKFERFGRTCLPDQKKFEPKEWPPLNIVPEELVKEDYLKIAQGKETIDDSRNTE